MASIKNLKKDINYILGDLISEASIKENKAEADKIVDEIIVTFDDLVAKINKKGIENKKAYFKGVNEDLEKNANAILDKINTIV